MTMPKEGGGGSTPKERPAGPKPPGTGPKPCRTLARLRPRTLRWPKPDTAPSLYSIWAYDVIWVAFLILPNWFCGR